MPDVPLVACAGPRAEVAVAISMVNGGDCSIADLLFDVVVRSVRGFCCASAWYTPVQ